MMQLTKFDKRWLTHARTTDEYELGRLETLSRVGKSITEIEDLYNRLREYPILLRLG
jgi:hypothetical protein